MIFIHVSVNYGSASKIKELVCGRDSCR